jgi:hypothetical protein
MLIYLSYTKGKPNEQSNQCLKGGSKNITYKGLIKKDGRKRIFIKFSPRVLRSVHHSLRHDSSDEIKRGKRNVQLAMGCN